LISLQSYYLKFKSFIPGIAWLLLVTGLLCLPGSTIPKNSFLALLHADKWVHIVLFGMLFLLFAYPLRWSAHEKKDRWMFLIALLGILFGVAMEFVQKYWVINRSFELRDIVADSAGCVLGWICAGKIWRLDKKIGPDRNRDRNQN
jgi:VanZ family protein